jgi:type VI secretion system secreted protein VgrG
MPRGRAASASALREAGTIMADDQRLIRVKSSLGPQKFLLREMHLTESLGQPFVIELTVDSDDLDINYKDILGDHLSLELDIGDNEHRYFDGIVTSFAYAGLSDFRASYHISLRPWLWLLTHHVQCKIFQGKTVPDIIKEVFRAAKFDDFEDKLQRGDYLTLDYCVQYRESDLAFVSRLMEQEGIYYYFKHSSGVHKLVLCDGATAHGKFDDKYGDVKIARSADDAQSGSLWDWALGQELQSGQYTHTDYDLEKPNADLKKSKSMAQGHKEDSFEIYDYPGKYTEATDGTTYAGLRMEEQVAQFERASGKTRTRWVATGCLIELKDSQRKGHNREYLVVETKSSVSAVGDGAGGGQKSFETEFHALATTQVFRSPRRTHKPFIRGPQTAFVVGKSGEEIWTDKYGRVKVQFHWDRDGQNDEKSSCWVRCAQSWASKSWGAMFIPRIGQEVMVHFLEGDPDRPIITGAVYNASAMPPYALPDNATRSTIKSNSSKGGNGFNEIRFEDKAGSEEFYVHAQKDMNTEVINDRSVTVKQGNEKKEVSQGTQTTKIHGDTSLTVDTGNCTVKVSTGSASVTVTQGITVESTLSITLKVANNSITIDATGVTIKGTMVSVEGQAMTEIKGLMTDVQASAMLTVKGAITMIG